MARLFGNEYHELSNSWYFKSSVIHLKKTDISYQHYLDENNNVIIKFEPKHKIQKIITSKLEIVYDREKRKILSHTCSDCGGDKCKHYLSILDYSYKYLSSEMLEKNVIQTYHAKLLNYNEYWQRTVLNARIEIGDIYSHETDKIRIYLKSYQPLAVRIISIIVANGDFKKEDLGLIPQAEKQMKALSMMELQLFKLLQKHKCSFSRKNYFYTIYKDSFIEFLPILKSLQHKTFIKETGDKIEFSNEETRVNFLVKKIGAKEYKLTISNNENLSAIYPGITTYLFKKNIVFSINLPFKKEITKRIFLKGYMLKETDLVYLASVVARQLGLIKCYLDFDDEIHIDEIYHNTPIITYKLYKENENTIIMEGLLDYGDEIFIPMSSILLPVELVRFDQQEKVRWFYIPPQIKYEILDFVKKIPDADTSQLEENSKLIFAGKEKIEKLKEIIFEYGKQSWNIHLSEGLKKEFIYKVTLEPIIKTRSQKGINWFEYEVEYNYKNIKFTHADLKNFFKTQEKFLKLEDGKLLFFENRKAFDEVDKLLKKSKKTEGTAYKLSIYNLPYVYQLTNVNKGITVAGDEYLETMFAAIIKRKLENQSEIPASLKSALRSYQKAGFQWLEMLKAYGMNGILADDMGLGKTVQAIAVISKLSINSRNLVICPKTLLFNWAAEIDKFNKSLSYRLYEGNKEERKNILQNLNVNLLFASYSIIQNDIKTLSEIEFDYIILDEAQHIKSPKALRTKAIKKLQAKNKMALSGTPIENNPLELWSIFDFLMPGYLPSTRKFKDKYVNSHKKEEQPQERLKMLVSPFILRRKKKDVLIELPDKQEQLIYCKMTKVQEKSYLQLLEKVKKSYFSSEQAIGSNFIHILAALTKLRQICNHPAFVEEEMKKDLEMSGKLETLRELIVDAVENDKKLLIFSQFVQMLQMLKKLLKKENIRFEYMDGSTKNRQQVIENFNENSKVRAFLISMKTGSFGLNLTAADTVIIVDPWWNPMGENQAIDRAHRIGQTKKVMVYKVITKNTIEEKIIALQENKKQMFENIIEKGQNVIKKMDVEQLRELLEY